MATKRKYEQDKVYLRGPNGDVWDHDPLLAKVPGYNAVVPNPSKKAAQIEKPADDIGTQGSTNAV